MLFVECVYFINEIISNGEGDVGNRKNDFVFFFSVRECNVWDDNDDLYREQLTTLLALKIGFIYLDYFFFFSNPTGVLVFLSRSRLFV